MAVGGIFHSNYGYFTAVATAVLVLLSSFLYQHVISYDDIFPAITILFKTKIGIVGVYTASLIVAFLLTIFLSRIILGRLTLLEVYVIHDNLLETCIEILMITAMFRNIASEKFFIPLIHMVIVKYFHWMLKERVGNMDRLPIVPFIYCLRILVLGNALFINDIKLAQHFCNRSLDNTFVQFIFYEQYVILVTYVIQNMAKFLLNFVNNTRKEPLIFKTTIATFIDMIIYICRSIIYILFCMFFAMEQTLPLFIIIPLIKTLIHGAQHGYTLIKTYYVFSEINKRCPFISDKEVEALNDKTCIVCREDMVQARRLPCLHAFHSNCLMLWVQNGSNCPTCRKDIISPPSSNSRSSNQPDNVDARARVQDNFNQPNNLSNNNMPSTNMSNNGNTQNESLNEPSPSNFNQHNILPIDSNTTNYNDYRFPTNLRENIPIYQGLPNRLFGFINKTNEIDTFAAFKISDIRLLLKETDNVLASNMTQSSIVTEANNCNTTTERKQLLEKAYKKIKEAQQLIEQELDRIT